MALIPSKRFMKSKKEDVAGLDTELNIYELTDMFYAYYGYHNNDNIISNNGSGDLLVDTEYNKYKKTLSRFEALRKVKAMYLGARTFGDDKQVAIHKPNISMGYMKLILTYLKLPFKSVFSDSDVVKVRIDKTLYNELNLSEEEKEEHRELLPWW